MSNQREYEIPCKHPDCDNTKMVGEGLKDARFVCDRHHLGSETLTREQEIQEELHDIDTLDMYTVAQICHDISKIKGWHDEPRSFGTYIALFHSEISEALEAYREHGTIYRFTTSEAKPEGVAIELADTIIRIFDYCIKNDIDIVEAIRIKCRYNLSRDYRHGGKEL